MAKSYRDLDVWKVAMDMVDTIYDFTEAFPDKEKFGLTNQLRRAAVSVPSNIAEGSAKNSTKDFLRYLSIVRGSLAELSTQLEISNRRKFGSEELHQQSVEYVNRIGQMSARLMQSLQSKYHATTNTTSQHTTQKEAI